MGQNQGPFPWLLILYWSVVTGVLFVACLGAVKLLSL